MSKYAVVIFEGMREDGDPVPAPATFAGMLEVAA